MGLFDSIGSLLFGGTEEKSKSTLNKNQKNVMKSLEKILKGNQAELDKIGANIPQFGGELSDLTQMSLAGLEQQALNRADGGTPEEQQAIAKLMEIINSDAQAFEELYERFQTEAVKDVEENVLPMIDRKFANRFFSSERGEAEARSREDLTDTLLNKRAELSFGTEQQRVQNALAAIGLLPEMQGAGINELMALTQAGMIPSDFELQKFQTNTGLFNTRLQQMLAMLGTPMKENVFIQNEGLVPGIAKGFATGVGANPKLL